MSKEIPLTQGKVSIVDDNDYEWLIQWRWCVVAGKYAGRYEHVNGKKVTIYMHRAILDAPNGMEVDHIHLDTFDNRRGNLRLSNKMGQAANRGVENYKRGKVSRYKGVTIDKRRGSIHAYIHFQNRKHNLGVHKTEEDAARAYNLAATNYFGEFARLNEVSPLFP